MSYVEKMQSGQQTDKLVDYAALGLFLIGAVLFLDELWMFGISGGHILPDLSFLHIDPFHHWMWGLALMIISVIIFLKNRW